MFTKVKKGIIFLLTNKKGVADFTDFLILYFLKKY